MTFLNPAFLPALAAVAIPVIVHLLSRRRVPILPFSSLRFLRRSDRRSMRRVKMRRLLLLVLRTAGIALVVLAFSRPVVRGGLAALFPGGGRRSGCILIDRSYSMGADEESGALFARAKARAEEVLRGFAPEDEVTVVMFGSSTEAVFSGRGGSLSALVEGEPISWETTDLRGAVREGLSLLQEGRREVRELYIVSDFQRSGLTPRAGGGGGSKSRAGAEGNGKGPPVRSYLLPIRAEGLRNVSIERIMTPRVALHRGEPASIEVLLRNNSPDGPARFPLTVTIDGRRILEREIEIAPGGSARERLAVPVERSGWLRGEARKGADRLRADDVRYFTLRIIERMRVLLLADERGLYLEQALSPEGADSDIELVKSSWSGFTSAELGGTDVIVLGTGGGPREGDVALIERFVEEGGKALVFIGRELDRAAAAMSRYPLSIRPRDAGEGHVSIARPHALPPFLAPFDSEDIDAITRLRFRRVAAVSGVPSGAALLRFSDGSPFMWEEERGGGSYVFCAADPIPEAGDFVLSPYFLPIVQQAVLATGRKTVADAEVTASDPIVWEGAARGEMRYTLPAEVPGGGERIGVPERAGAARGGRERIVLPPAGAPGFVALYEGADTLCVFAVNPDTRAESDLAAASGEEAADSLGLAHYVVIEGAAPLSEAVTASREGREITIGLALAAIALFVTESIVAQKRYGGDRNVA